MSSTPQPVRAVYEAAIRDAVRQALLPYGDDVATVDEGHNGDESVWGVEVQPKNPGAAASYVSYWAGDEICLGFGQTHVYMWDDDPQALADEVRAMLAAVYAGRVEEVGHGDAFARLHLEDGSRTSVGRVHLPLPWRFRRVRRYAPLSHNR